MTSGLESAHPADLERQLAEKDELIGALTSQLELAVERLDRLRRSGADRPAPPAGSPVPNPTGSNIPLSSDPELGSKLSLVLEEWSELRPLDRFDKIENNLEQVLDLLSQLSVSGISSPREEAHSAAESWEQTKSRLLREEAARPREQTYEEFPEITSYLEDSAHAPPPPAPVSPEDDASALFTAVESRDVYIHYLTERLRKLEQTKWGPIDWSELQHVPEQFKTRIQQLEMTLQEQLKRTEIAHSLERADLARERARLTQMKQNLEHQIKRMSMGSSSTTIPALKSTQTEPPPPPPTKPEPEKSWKKLFSR